MRSSLERRFADALDAKGIEYLYEEVTIKYFKKVHSGMCDSCGSTSILKAHTYLTDFYIPKYDFYIETKGRLKAETRSKHKAIQKCNPGLDIRFVFESDNWTTTKHIMRYSDWCNKNNFKYFIRVPGSKTTKEILLNEEWFND